MYVTANGNDRIRSQFELYQYYKDKWQTAM
jgi:hypothetical protein